jgi:regulator of protease activity HflC (stomatin/prohibitin superfamily)
VYDAVAKERALDAKDKRDQIAVFVDKRVKDIVAGKPFEVQRVVIGAIDFPDTVEKAQDAKVASETMLQQKKFEIEIAKQDAVRRVEEAKGIAEAQAIINASLTDRYLQHEAIKAQEKMASSPNHTTIYVPSGTNGIPLIRTVN